MKKSDKSNLCKECIYRKKYYGENADGELTFLEFC